MYFSCRARAATRMLTISCLAGPRTNHRVPPVNTLSVQDFKNLFTWANILKYPVPLIAICCILSAWILLAVCFTFIARVGRDQADIDVASPTTASCCDRGRCGFYLSTDSMLDFLQLRIKMCASLSFFESIIIITV
jgi:hypothetical protein